MNKHFFAGMIVFEVIERDDVDGTTMTEISIIKDSNPYRRLVLAGEPAQKLLGDILDSLDSVEDHMTLEEL